MDRNCTVALLCKSPQERIPVTVDWHDYLAHTREPGARVELETVMRPLRQLATGYQYRCTVAGVSNSAPFNRLRWPIVEGMVLRDGSVEWTTEAIDEESLRTTIVDEAWTATEGAQLSGEESFDSVYRVQVEGGAPDQHYMVTHTATFANGERHEQRTQIDVES